MTNIDPSTRYLVTVYNEFSEPLDSFPLTAPDFATGLTHVSRVIADHDEADQIRSLSIIPETAPEKEGEPATGF